MAQWESQLHYIERIHTTRESIFLVNEGKGGNDLVETKCGPTVDVKFDFIRNLEYSNDGVKEEEDNMMDGEGG